MQTSSAAVPGSPWSSGLAGSAPVNPQPQSNSRLCPSCALQCSGNPGLGCLQGYLLGGEPGKGHRVAFAAAPPFLAALLPACPLLCINPCSCCQAFHIPWAFFPSLLREEGAAFPKCLSLIFPGKSVPFNHVLKEHRGGDEEMWVYFSL